MGQTLEMSEMPHLCCKLKPRVINRPFIAQSILSVGMSRASCNCVFSKTSRSIMNSVNLVNSQNQVSYWSMNWVSCKDPLCCLCFTGTEVECQFLFLTQEIAGSNTKIRF